MRRALDTTTHAARSLRCGRIGRVLAVVASIGMSLLVLPRSASAHIDPEPPEAQAGSRLSVGFTVEHGCAGSPTIQLDMRLPDGVTDAVPEPPDGWSGSRDEDVVTFTGGPLPDHEELTFRVALTLPPTPDTTIFFPFVQRCEEGEIRWIDVPVDGTDVELDEPAPALHLVGPVATSVATTSTTAATTVPATGAPTVTTDPVTTEPGDSDAAATTTEPTATTTEPTATTGTGPEPSEPSPVTVAETTDDAGGDAAILVAVVVGLAAAAAVAFLVVRRRR